MARFKGWNLAAVEKLKIKLTPPKTAAANIKLSKAIFMLSPTMKIQSALQSIGIESVAEYKFLKDRRFRFDLAIPSEMIAIEFEGGIFTGGRHTRGKGYSNDAKKYNLAVMHGWKLIRYTPDVLSKKDADLRCALEIQYLINQNKKEKQNAIPQN